MNVTGAVVAYLRADGRVSGLAAERVYGSELPRSAAAELPRKTIVVMASGIGGTVGDRSDVRETGNRMDIRCYGETPYQADVLHGAVYRAMKDLRRERHDDITLQVAEVGGGPLPGRDTDADWPYTLGVYVVNATYD